MAEVVNVNVRMNHAMMAAMDTAHSRMDDPTQTVMDVAVIFAAVVRVISDDPVNDAQTMLKLALEYTNAQA